MTVSITATGVRITLIALPSFPVGLVLTQFADDTDAIDIPPIDITAVGMGLNGDMVTWKKATLITVNLGIIPSSDDDNNLALLLENNRAGRNKFSVEDDITLIVDYPDGIIATFAEGRLLSGMPSNSGTSDGREKSKVYSFAFNNRTYAR